MMWIFWGVTGLVAVCLLGGSVNMGVAAQVFKQHGRKRYQWLAVVLSVVLGAGALLCAFAIGQSVPPH